MPTFSSIGIHPLLRKRLVTESIHSGDHQFVTTPQALLSRNPGQLRLLNEDGSSSRPIAIPQVLKLRHEVATALIAQSKTGDRFKRVRNNTRTRDEGDTERRHDGLQSTTTKKPKLTIPGTVTALELLGYSHTAVTTINGELRTPVLRTGCNKLDELVALPAQYDNVSTCIDILPSFSSAQTTGIPFGYVIQFSGPPATGKTQMALHLAIAKDLHQTWYVCSSTPQVQRLWELCHHNNAIMQRTVFTTATNDYQVLQRLAELEVYLIEQHQNENSAWKPVLLVLDSCSGCLSPPTENEGDSLLMTVAATIRQLSRHYNLATVLINGTVSNRDTTTTTTTVAIQRPYKAALGHRWNNTVADIALWFEPNSSCGSSTGIGSVCGAKLVRHTMKHCADEESATFCITAQGIQDVP